MNASTKNIFSSFLAVSLLCIPTLSGCDTAEQSGEAMKGIEALDDVAEGDELLAVEDDIAAPVFYAESARALPDQYIVVMKNTVRSSTVDDLLLSTALRDGDEINETYDSVLVGFSGRFSPETIEDLRHDPDVAYIEQDQYVELSGVASWGLDRIDQAGLPLDNQLIRPGTGDGVHTYIMDTGVRLTHNEFAGRIGFGFTTIYDGRGYDDCHGHGTHVAGTVAGTTYGVAPDAIIHPVRIFSCTAQDTSLSMIINAMNWVRYNHQSPAV
ncbi:MAG: S8 family serine peptidase, partial [Nannocystaceae bacterium]